MITAAASPDELGEAPATGLNSPTTTPVTWSNQRERSSWVSIRSIR